MKNVYVLGSNGMLGKYVTVYLSQTEKYNVIPITRKEFEVSLFSESELTTELEKLGVGESDIIINCIGLIKQRDDISDIDFLTVNTIFPLTLAKICDKRKIELIHVSSDCAYDGLGSSYNEDDLHDAKDSYGLSKSLGESNLCTVVRTSIIGEEENNKLSLIEWVKSNENNTVNGYMNHHWNGITCLQYAKICDEIITYKKYWKGVRHINSPTALNKFELVGLINDVYDLNITVNGVDTPTKCDRTLSTKFDSDFNIPELSEQILEQKNFKI